MPETNSERTIFSLLDVMKSIQRMVLNNYTSAYWIKAEMNKLNYYSHSGHCYPELVEKQGGKVIAQVRSTLWKEDYRRINLLFLNTVKEPLKDGIKILFCARVGFDPVYGFTLNIVDIDPSYSLGDLEKEKAETIKQLQTAGLFNANKLRTMPLLPKRVAIISVETSKGYSDFMNILKNNSWGYAFFTMLFPALLQGEKAVESIVSQLEHIEKVKSHFDVVAIVRGGGGDVGLSCYNHIILATAIVHFPLPVITGIGHSTNETVAEMISFKNAITPTELADFLLQKFHNFSVPVNEAQQSIIRNSKNVLNLHNMRFDKTVTQFRADTRNYIASNNYQINNKIQRIQQQSLFVLHRNQELQEQTILLLSKSTANQLQFRKQTVSDKTEQLSKQSQNQLNNQTNSLQNLTQLVNILNPQNVLKRGFSITMVNGKSVKSINNIKNGETITTQLADGTIESNIISTAKNRENER